MRAVFAASVLVLLAGLSGCAVYEVGSAVVDVGATAVSTTADVAGTAVGAVTGGDSDEDKKKD